MDPTPDQLIEMYRRMVRIRYFEEAAKKLLLGGEVPGGLHTSIGQEAEIVGACMALRTDDYMVGNHRSHGHPIGKGAESGRLFAELLGKVTGVNSGKGGSMHLSDFSVGSLGETSIVGSGIPVATGAALGSKMQGNDRVTLCFFGDGASNEGTFHEGLNLAAIWKLPAVFLCENNGYGEMSAARDVIAVQDIAARAAGYDIPGITVDGQDVVAVFEVVTQAVQRARQGEGPSLVEAKTYRYDNHAIGLAVEHYRTQDEIDRWRERDPVKLFESALRDQGVLDDEGLERIRSEVRAEIEAGVEFARSSAYPEPEDAYEHLFTNPIGQPRPPARLADLPGPPG
jgi:acetoin:2,6-dichlorophenolindophenol oxidoreductase subunit alpha